MTTIIGPIIDEHGNTIYPEQLEQIIVTLTEFFETLRPAWEAMAQCVLEFGAALTAAFETIPGPNSAQWRLLTGEPDLDDPAYAGSHELAYRDYARWYNARHPGRRVSWRRLNSDQRWEAEQRFG